MQRHSTFPLPFSHLHSQINEWINKYLFLNLRGKKPPKLINMASLASCHKLGGYKTSQLHSSESWLMKFLRPDTGVISGSNVELTLETQPNDGFSVCEIQEKSLRFLIEWYVFSVWKFFNDDIIIFKSFQIAITLDFQFQYWEMWACTNRWWHLMPLCKTI